MGTVHSTDPRGVRGVAVSVSAGCYVLRQRAEAARAAHNGAGGASGNSRREGVPGRVRDAPDGASRCPNRQRRAPGALGRSPRPEAHPHRPGPRCHARPARRARTADEAAELSSVCHFEHHIKLLLSGEPEMASARAVAERHSAHLSRNARRAARHGRHERFVTQRCRGVGRPAAAALLDRAPER